MRVTGTSQKTTDFIFAAQGTPHRDYELSLIATSLLRNEIFMFERPPKYLTSLSHSERIYYRPLNHYSRSLLRIREYLYLRFSALISTPSPYYVCL